MAEMCLREENFQMYLHMRSCERATRKVKRSINKARGKGKRISCLPERWFTPVNPERALLQERQQPPHKSSTGSRS